MLAGVDIIAFFPLLSFEIFFMKYDFENEFKDNTKNLAADSEIGFFTKSTAKPYGRATAMPPACKLKLKLKT